MAEEENTEANEEGEKKKGGMLKIILMVVGAILISAISVVATMMLMPKPEPTDPMEAIEKELVPEDQVTTPEQGEAIYFPLKDPFVINYNDNGRQRYLKLELSVVARDQESIDAVNTHLPLIRNNLLEVLQGQNYAALRTNDGKKALVEVLTTTIQDILLEEVGRPGVERVLFLNFVLQ